MEIEKLKKITPWQELLVIQDSEELQCVLKSMAERVEVPGLLETEGKGDAEAALHYFNIMGTGDWYIFEADLETGEAFGFVTLSGDIADPFAEFGYIDLNALCRDARINLDLHFSGISKKEIMKKKWGKE